MLMMLTIMDLVSYACRMMNVWALVLMFSCLWAVVVLSMCILLMQGYLSRVGFIWMLVVLICILASLN